MKKFIAMVLALGCVLSLIGCNQYKQQDTTSPTQSANTDEEFYDQVPYDAMLNLEVMNGKFKFQRIATTPCIVYSNASITDMSKGTMYNDRHDILTTIFRATDGKNAIIDTSECEFLHYIYMFDNEREDIPWHYRFAICNCGAVMITDNDELICTIELTAEEIQSILNALGLTDNETVNSSEKTQTETGYFIPDYNTTNNLNCDEFLKTLKSDGYIRDGEKDYNYNTDNITRIVNITPKSISDETSDIEVFCVNEIHCFLMVNHTIYRYDTFGGYHHQLCLWDYDGNGTKDLVSYNTSGSGLSYMSVDIFDLTSFEGIQVITRMTLDEPEFSFECKNGMIYIDGEELTYSDGSFHCNSFNKDAR